ncbi:MAG: MFS transporter [Dongiaceae bacterium]
MDAPSPVDRAAPVETMAPAAGALPRLSDTERRLSLVGVLATAFVSTLTFAMSTPLLALNLEAAGIGAFWIGVNTATESAAILLFTLVTPALARRFGTTGALYIGIGVMAVGTGLLPVFRSIEAWFLLRILMGAGVAVLWVVGETWMNAVAEESKRGRTSGAYVAVMSAAYCLGFPLLIVTGTDGILPFVVITVAVTATYIPVFLARRFIPDLTGGESGGYASLARRQPVVVGAAVANGMIIGIVLAFFVIFVGRLGMSEETGLLMLFVLAAGNVVLQIPIGMLADRFRGEPLLGAVALASVAGFALLPAILGLALFSWPVLFLWGGTIGAAYTIALAMVGRRYRPGELAAANALFAFAYEGGTLLGPIGSGLALDLWDANGFLVGGIGANLIMLLLLALFWRRPTALPDQARPGEAAVPK